MKLSAVTVEQKEKNTKIFSKHQNIIGDVEDVNLVYSEFEDFLAEFCGLVVSDGDKYNRQRLGHYFSPLDDYFKLWLNARCVYATSHLP